MTDRTIDYSRYRLAESIAGLYEAGEDVRVIADQWFGFVPEINMRDYVVELIVAAHDRKGRYEPK